MPGANHPFVSVYFFYFPDVTATRVILARIAKISMCHAVRLHAGMVVRAKPSILSTTNAVVRLVNLIKFD